MIVLNGMPFIEASLNSIYKHAYEIIIIEGAVKEGMFASDNGCSVDGTIDFVKNFRDEDNKIKFIQGIWPEKCEMQNRALELASGDYAWLIDSDEVYKETDIDKVINILKEDSTITQIDFPAFHFWKGFENIIDSYILDNKSFFQRLFKIDKPCYFKTHRPPTLVFKEQGKTADSINRLTGNVLKAKEIYLYHYSYVLEKQVKQKIELYRRYGWEKSWKIDLNNWYNNCFLKWTIENRESIEKKYPILTGDIHSKTKIFRGMHPQALLNILSKIQDGR